MMTQQQFLDAVADFEGLVADGWETEAAVAEAARSNDISDPTIFESRLTREMSLYERAEKIRHKASHDHFIAIAREEVARCKKREGIYEVGGLRMGPPNAEEMIMDAVEARLQRSLTEHESWIIEEMRSPAMFDVRQRFRFGLEAPEKRSFRS